jgi:uracil-DNA glycosylase
LAVKDVGIKETKKGTLDNWAKQGVFMLNAVLTVRHKEANSHQGKGWVSFEAF